MSGQVRVLVVEDDPSLREVLLEVLLDQGWHVVAASRGEEALARAREERFDLILADIRMDGINGLDTIEQARELQPDIGSIVVSGFATEEETLRAVKLNVAGYLKKPFKMPELMELITSFMAQREEQNRRDREVRSAREAFLWALERWGAWADREQAGRLARGSELARGLALGLGFPEDLARQLSLGALLRSLDELEKQSFPEEVTLTLAAFPLLLGALREETSAEVATVARNLCKDLGEKASWPEPEALPGNVSAKLRDAYNNFLGGGEPQSRAETNTGPGLLSLGRTLEHAGDWDGAERAFKDAAQASGTSHLAVQSLLGLARICLARGQTGGLEKSVSSLLELAETLGPVSLALAELEAAEVLRRGGHPAAPKLLERAARNLAAVGMGVPWARAILALHAFGLSQPGPLLKALSHLAARAHRLEVLEQLDTVLPDLLELGAPSARLPDEAATIAARLSAELVRDYAPDVAVLLRGGRLSLAARTVLLKVASGLSSLPADLLAALQSDSEAEIRAGALVLGAKLGRTESRPILRVSSLGTLEVRIGDQRIDDKVWKTQKTKYLFARLVENAPRALSVDRVMEDLWPGSAESARNNLNTSVSLIRKHLNLGDGQTDPVLRNTETVGLNPELPLWHDADELEKAALAAHRHLEAGNLENALSYFARVARLYRGAFLEGCYMDWALERRNQLENRAAMALEQLAHHRQEAHRHREALEYGLALLGLQPENTVGHDTVMRAYISTEQHSRAVAHFEAYQAALAQDGGAEPATELVRTYQMARYGFHQAGPGLSLD